MNEPVVNSDPKVNSGLDNYLNLPAKQQPTWPDAEKVAAVRAELAIQPPLVFAGEVDILRARLAEAAFKQGIVQKDVTKDAADLYDDSMAKAIKK